MRAPSGHAELNSVQKVASHDDLPNYGLDYSWNNNSWDTLGQVTNVYAANGDLVEEQYDFYDNGQFDPSSKRMYSYNSNGDVTEETLQIWNNGLVENTARTVQVYDAMGNLTEIQSYTWVSNAWDQIGGLKYAYSYNSSNELIETITEVWNDGTSTYEPLYKQETQWANGEWSEYESFRWAGNAWVPNSKTVDIMWHDFSKRQFSSLKNQRYGSSSYIDHERGTWTYAQNGDNTRVFENYANGNWTNSTRVVTNYDSRGHESLTETYLWMGSWALDVGYEYTYLYDGQDRTLEVITQRRDQTLVLSNLAKTVYGSFFVGAVSPVEANVAITAFPNPVTDQLSFDIALEKNGPVVITLFDIQGRKRLETTSSYNGNAISIPVSESLENGVYFYQLRSGDALAKGKIVVQH